MAYLGALQVNNVVPAPVQTLGEGEWVFRRILKAIESQAAADGQQRQRFTLDAITAGLTLAAVTTVSTVTTVTNAVPVGNVATIAGMGDEQYINISRQTAANCIRQRLTTTGAVSGP
jgi:hypothetical protein